MNMYNIESEGLVDWKDAFLRGGIQYKTDEEYYEAIQSLTGFIDTLIEIDKRLNSDAAPDHAKDSVSYLHSKNKINTIP